MTDSACLPLDRHQEDVVGLEIAVDDARGVGRGQPRRDLVDDADDRVERKRRLAHEPLRQALAREVLHDQVLGAVGRGVVVDDLDDVGVLQQRGDVRLAGELRQRRPSRPSA